MKEMKKSLFYGIILALILTLLLGQVVLAGTAFSNAKATFSPRTASGTSPDAQAMAIINYDKELQAWQVNGKVRGLQPNTVYSVELGTINVWGGSIVATFTTEGDGNATFNNLATNVPPTYNVARIIFGTTPTQSGQFLRLRMIAQEGGGFGLLVFRGTQRGE